MFEQVDEMNRRQGLVIDAWKKLEEKLKDCEKAEKDWLKVERDGQDLLDCVENISSKLYPIVGGLNSRNYRDVLAHLEVRTDELSKSKLTLQKVNLILVKIGELSSGRLLAAASDRKKAEILARTLNEKQSSLQVLSSTLFS